MQQQQQNWHLLARTKCLVVSKDGCGGKKLFLVAWAELAACKEPATLDLEIVAQDIPGTTPSIVFTSFVLIPAVILRDFCLTKHRGIKPPAWATHVGQRLGLPDCHQPLSLHPCPCQAASVMLQPWHSWGKVMVGSGTVICWRVEKLQGGGGDLPLTVWTLQQCKVLEPAQALLKREFYVLGLDSSFIVFGSVVWPLVLHWLVGFRFWGVLLVVWVWFFFFQREEASTIHL